MMSGTKSQKVDIFTQVKAEKIIAIQDKMAKSEPIQTVVMQVAFQVTTATVMVIIETNAPGTNTFSSGEAHRHRPALRQTHFSWNVPDTYEEWLNFTFGYGIYNILQTKTYRLAEEENVPIIKNWLEGKEWALIEIFTNSEKEACKRVKGLSSMQGEQFKPHHNKIILSLHYCKWTRKITDLPRSGWADCE